MEVKARPEPGGAPSGGEAPAPRDVLWSKPVRAVLTLLVLAAIAQLLPPSARLRVLESRPSERHEAFPAVPPASSAVGEAELERPTENRPDLAQPEKLEAPVRAASPIAQGAAESVELSPADTSPLPIVDR